MYTRFHIRQIYAVHESPPTEHALSQRHTWLSQDTCRNTPGQTFWQSGIRHRGAYQKKEFTTGPAVLQMKTPETWNRIYWGSHMQHIYTVQPGEWEHSQQEVLQSSENRKETRQDATRRPDAKTKDRTAAEISLRSVVCR